MPNFTRLSNASATCIPTEALGGRPATETSAAGFEWRPSRWLIGALGALAVLAPLAVLASEMPRPWAWPLAAVACVHGAWLAMRELHKPTCWLRWPIGPGSILVDGRRVHDVQLRWRGPLALVRWRDDRGRIRRMCWWPDTLAAALRRELRLAEQSRAGTPAPTSMSP